MNAGNSNAWRRERAMIAAVCPGGEIVNKGIGGFECQGCGLDFLTRKRAEAPQHKFEDEQDGPE